MRGGLVVLAALVAGCGGTGAPRSMTAPPPAMASAMLGPDHADVFTDGSAATAALLEAARGARGSIDAEIYEFGRQDLLLAMLDAIARGVRVRVVADPTVDVTVATGRRLAAAGAEVAFFPVAAQQIDHVKLLVVDGAIGLFGGVNWGAGSYLNHDFELRLRGPAVSTLARIFDLDLARSGRPTAIPRPPAPVAGEPGILTSYPDDEVGRAVVRAIRGARHSIEVEMYVMTDPETIRALAAAARRGVWVQVLFDPGQDLNQAAMGQLLPAGVRCRFHRSHGEKLHAKTAVLDGRVLIVGSANWTASGFRHNHELDAVVESPVLATAVTARMDSEWAAAA